MFNNSLTPTYISQSVRKLFAGYKVVLRGLASVQQFVRVVHILYGTTTKEFIITCQRVYSINLCPHVALLLALLLALLS